MLSELVRARLQALGVSQRQAARTANLSPAQLNMMLSGQVFNLTTETAGKLAQMLGVPAEDVFNAALADVERAATVEAATTGDAA